MNEYCIVMTTTSSIENADQIANALIKNKLAACVQRTSIDSTYEWEGRVCNDKEFLLLAKSRSALISEIEATIKSAHNYRVPEIIVVGIEAGSASYLEWLSSQTGR